MNKIESTEPTVALPLLRGIIFDFDGTLVDSLGDAMASFNYAIERLGERPRTAEEIKRYFGTGADRILSQVLGDEAKGQKAFKFYKEHQALHAHHTSLHKGIEELLDRIAAEKVPTAIVTGRHSEDLAIAIEHHQIAHRFITLIADNHVMNSKPAPDGILLAAKRMGLSPGETMYVGDSPVDVRAARSAGAIAVAALWDLLARREQLEPHQPHHCAENPQQVWEAFSSRRAPTGVTTGII
jgi:HAD superfamily hydrolase (TIGR01509 family)